ncbi:cupin domain-containing protein [Henriciella aquimarina]|uniref:cupin domain-containing protein n=1 Tax=Henriciella aquimarina TaxID=545261 RepID=UPI000A00241C|nr:cupin domain-containing protein [Henriciella aquimarina]
MADSKQLERNPVHLGKHGKAAIEPAFTGDMEWFMAYGARHADDGPDGRLVSMHTFTGSWDSWEVHPRGHEVVLCTAGRMRLIQEYPDGHGEEVTIGPGEYVVNDPGVWHTADVIEGPATAVFITAGEGTDHRPR